MATENCNFPSTLDMNELPIVRIKLNTPPLKCIVKGTYSISVLLFYFIFNT